MDEEYSDRESRRTLGAAVFKKLKLADMSQAGAAVKKLNSFIPIRLRRLPTDPFFNEGNFACAQGKQAIVSLDEEDLLHESHKAFECKIAGCNQVFTTLNLFEEHYGSNHWFVCSQCRRNFPSNHLLELHVLEEHDSLFQLMATKKDMYQCLVQTCCQTFASPALRKDHVVKFHRFPANFRFRNFHSAPSTAPQVRSTIVSKDSHLAVEELNQPCLMEIKEDTSNLVTTHLPTRKINYVSRVPGSICFGQCASRGFQRSKTKGMKKKGSIDMANISKALQESVDEG